MEDKPGALEIKTFADHHVITQPNPLQKVLRRVAEKDLDDPVARAEKALAGLSGEFMRPTDSRPPTPQFSETVLPTSPGKSCFVPPTISRVTPPLSDTPLPGLPPRACAGSSSTRPISTRCRPS